MGSENIDVSVDQHFARFGSKSYAINKINSVEVRRHQPYGIAGIVICGGLAMLLIFAALGQSAGPNSETPVTSLIIAAVLAGLAWMFGKRHQIVEYQLFLMTSSSEAQAFQSRDEQRVIGLRDAIEQAMASPSGS